MAERADVVIIGGGIMGTSLAFALTQLGVRDVMIVERRTLAAGASGRTGALLRQHYSNVPEATLAHLSLLTYANWAEEIGGDCGFVNTGSIVTVTTSGEDEVNIERMHRNIAMQNRVGIQSEVISADRLRELQPFTRVDDVAVAAYERDSGYVDAVAATRTMAEAAMRGGARVAEERTVTAIRVDGDRIVGSRYRSGANRRGTSGMCGRCLVGTTAETGWRRGTNRGAAGAGSGVESTDRHAGERHDDLRRHRRRILLPQCRSEPHPGRRRRR